MMEVFISWSGEASHQVACALRDWLPSVIQAITPYVSSEDIDKGARWSSDIAKELDGSGFGILCLTKDNFEAPWLNFEAGALSKSVDKSKVCPFLFQMERSDVTGPLLQFQSTLAEQEDIRKLVNSVNLALPGNERLEDERLAKVFEVWWPQLQDKLDEIALENSEIGPVDSSKAEVKQEAILEEILELSRLQQRKMADPEEILPPQYLRHVFRRYSKNSDSLPHHPAVFEARSLVSQLSEKMLDDNWDSLVQPEVRKSVESLIRHLEYVFERWN